MANKKAFLSVLMVVCLTLAAIGLSACGGTEMKSISTDTSNVDVVFEKDSEFNTDNLVVFGKQGDGKNVRIPAESYTITAPDLSTEGEKTVTITYGDLTTTYKIEVVVKAQTAQFEGLIEMGVGAGGFVKYPAEFRFFNTMKYELWYRCAEQDRDLTQSVGDKTPSNLATRTIRMRATDRYKLQGGVYTLTLAIGTVSTAPNEDGKPAFHYTHPSLTMVTTADGVWVSSRPAYGDFTLVTP